MHTLQIVVITGLSGAGKTQALRALEDLGFYCVDNLPPALLETFADFCLDPQHPIDRVGLVIDARGGDFFSDLLGALDRLKARGIWHRLVYLDADEDVILRRFEETRRKHPLPSEGGLAESIRDERQLLAEVHERADVVLDTTKMAPHLLKRRLASLLIEIVSSETLFVQIVSFGFKYGLPAECDLVFDIRFLPNPHHEHSLRRLSGLDTLVQEYVMESAVGREFLHRLRDFLTFCLPEYEKEGKSYLTIGIGCTGGRHRSVAVGEEVGRWVRELGYQASVRHRDLHQELRPENRPASAGEVLASAGVAAGIAVTTPESHLPAVSSTPQNG